MTFEIAEKYGFWAIVLFWVLDRVVIPLANKLIPARIKAKQTFEERVVATQENFSNALVQISEILRQNNQDHATIMDALMKQSASLAILLDRVERKKTVSQKTKT